MLKALLPKFSGEYRVVVKPETIWKTEADKAESFDNAALLKQWRVPMSDAQDVFIKNPPEVSCHVGFDGAQMYLKTPLAQHDKEGNAVLVEKLLSKMGINDDLIDTVKSGILKQQANSDALINGVPELKNYPVRVLAKSGDDLLKDVKFYTQYTREVVRGENDPEKSYNAVDLLKFHPNASTLSAKMLVEVMGEAFRQDNTDMINYLTQVKTIPFTVRTETGHTMAHFAAKGGHLDWLKFLKQEGVNLHDVNNDYKESLLELAADFADVETVKYLLEQGLNINHQEKTGHSALHFAVLKPEPTMAEFLLSKGADPKAVTQEGDTIAHYVAESVYSEKLIKTILDRGVSFNQKNNRGDTAFHVALVHGNTVAINHLLDNDKSLNLKNDQKMEQLAARLAKVETLKKLHQKGVKFTTRDFDGNTPAHHAMYHFNVEALLFLREIGVDFKLRNHKGQDVPAVREMDFAMFNEFLDRYKSVNINRR